MKKQKFSYYEKRSIVSMTAMLLVYGAMFYGTHTYYKAAVPKEDLLRFWGGQFWALFVYLVTAHVVSMLVFNVLHKKLTGEARPKVKDERDNAIELKAVSAEHYTLVLGVFVAMLLAMWVQSNSPIFLGVMVSFMASGIVSDGIRIILYRKSS